MVNLESGLMKLRYMTVLAVFASILGAGLLFLLGARKTFEAFVAIFRPGAEGALVPTDQAVAFLIQSMDAFLIGLVFLVFGYGINTLFVQGVDRPSAGDQQVFGWIQIRSVGQLKGILAELVVIVLFVKFLEIALLNLNRLKWELLVLPAAILMLSLALKFLELKKLE